MVDGTQLLLAGRLAAAGLALVAGFVDAYGYLKWHLFGANMTGNTVMFAISLYQDPMRAVLPLALIVAFTAGSTLGRALVDRFSPTSGLIAEALLLIVAAFGSSYGTLVFISLAMGVQNASLGTFSGVQANTSFITGDYSKFGAAIADAFSERAGRDKSWKTLSILAPVVGAYALGAVVAVFCGNISYQVLFVVPVILAVAYASHRLLLT